MFRKVLLALAATATIGFAAATPASAGYWHGHKSYGFYTPSYYSYSYRPYCYTKKIWVDTYYGPVAKWIKVCN